MPLKLRLDAGLDVVSNHSVDWTGFEADFDDDSCGLAGDQTPQSR